MTPNEWSSAACHELLGLRATTPGWGYRQGARPSVEPTALAGLGLVASLKASDDSAVRAAADWLASIQNQDGSMGLSAGQTSPCWTTPYALLFWNALPGFEKARQRAATWLLQQRGRTNSADSDPDHVIGHDPTLVGWPWVTDTHSWLEPTAISILALSREGYGDHPRVREGVRLIIDRALPDGGWNYGNRSAFGNVLRAQPGPTGLALLALAEADGSSKVVEKGVQYLRKTLPTTRAPASLGWGVLGLRSWKEDAAESNLWLAESYQRTAGRPDAAMRLALLLLAGGEASLPLLVGNSKGGRRG
ncbi:prenyltransferase/squalene oxidase repeat-containing protein [Singulisphaera acidiphila]|uniref:prenyltransferase/squalene oxidase repeat-containing protein n=1 Tax=Singulisphaera acidiphila TaxID=466153 RepID=UPI001ED96454|nr:prenyltransferase/squalene oxidase repeat-containing protein [Singulisphaera acidiphila]